MKILYHLSFALPLLAAMTLSSCTISEPDENIGESSNPQDLRLTSITFGGMKLLSVDYDPQGRYSKITLANDLEYNLEYNGSSKIPSAVNTKEWDEEYNNETDREEYVIRNTSSWSNIQTNSEGYIVGYDYKEVNYNSAYYDWETDTYIRTTDTYIGHSTITYDADGHMTSQTFNETCQETGSTSSNSDTYTWEDGLLIATSEGDTYEYSNVDNKLLQWDPLNETFGPLAITNLFGIAPSKFMSRGKFDGESVQVAYNIFDNGLINMQRRYEDGQSYTYKFNYQKK